MADFERTVLEFYQLSTPFPSEWPTEKDEEEELSSGDDGEATVKPVNLQRRKSRYQALERIPGQRRGSQAQTSEGGKAAVGTLVQKDEHDPLGTSDSVVRHLKSLGLPVQDDVRLRMLPSITQRTQCLHVAGVNH